MKILNVNNNYSSKKQPSFQSLYATEVNLKQAGEYVFEGVKLALTPQKDKLFSNIQELANKADISIFAFPATDILRNKLPLFLKVQRGNIIVHCDKFETTAYKTAQELADALDEKITAMYKSAGNSGHKTLL